jgi:hypothetical protein
MGGKRLVSTHHQTPNRPFWVYPVGLEMTHNEHSSVVEQTLD